MSAPVHVVVVYQSLLGIYGDQGNAAVLRRRLEWRGIECTVTFAEPGTTLPDDAQIYLLGGGEDGAQVAAVRALSTEGGLHRAVDRGAAVLAVCAGYQIAGKTFTVGHDEQVVDGLGLLDVTTTRAETRAVGEILTRWEGQTGDDAWLTGFENHGGRTVLGPDAAPLARVVHGVGNGGDGTEGAVAGSVIGTYPHGPILVRNPALADHLLRLGTGLDLAPLEVPGIAELRAERLAAVRAP